MKLLNKILISLLLIPISCSFLYSKVNFDHYRAPSIGGTTGLITTPTAHLGWAESNFGINTSYNYINESNHSHIPKITVHLLKMCEIGAAYDIQDREEDQSDLLVFTKFSIFKKDNSAIAVGGNYQKLKQGTKTNYHNGQLYVAASYSSKFFNMPAETTIVIGKTFGDDTDKNLMDFSMGFELNLVPRLFKGHAHWINDISNYSYSNDPKGDNYWRGIYNTGIRFAILNKENFKLNVDFIISDAFDNSRSFVAGAAFGFSI